MEYPTKPLRQLLNPLLPILAIIFGAAGFANAQDIHKDTVRVALHNESILAGLRQIEQQSPVRFVYRKTDLDNLRNITLQPATRTIAVTLQLLLQGISLSFRQVEGNVLLEQTNTQAAY